MGDAADDAFRIEGADCIVCGELDCRKRHPEYEFGGETDPSSPLIPEGLTLYDYAVGRKYWNRRYAELLVEKIRLEAEVARLLKFIEERNYVSGVEGAGHAPEAGSSDGGPGANTEPPRSGHAGDEKS